MDGRRRWWDGVWCWNWYWQTVAVLCLSIQGRRTYRATGKGTFFVGPSPNRGGGGALLTWGRPCRKMGTCTLDAMGSRQFWPQWTVQWNFTRDRIFCLCGPAWVCLRDSLSQTRSGVVDHPLTQPLLDTRVACPQPSPHQARRPPLASPTARGLAMACRRCTWIYCCSLAGRRRGLRGVAACPVKWKHETLLGAFGTWRGQLAQLRSTALWSLAFSFQVIPKVT